MPGGKSLALPSNLLTVSLWLTSLAPQSACCSALLRTIKNQEGRHYPAGSPLPGTPYLGAFKRSVSVVITWTPGNEKSRWNPSSWVPTGLLWRLQSSVNTSWAFLWEELTRALKGKKCSSSRQPHSRTHNWDNQKSKSVPQLPPRN